MDATWERLKASKSHADEGKEGLRMVLNGGFHKVADGGKRKQKAIIEFTCDPDKTGLENLWDPEDKYDDDEKTKKRDDKEDDEKKNANTGYDPEASSLKYVSYKVDATDSNTDVLRLEWLTKYACEDNKDKENAAKSSHWGFFTWFILM